MDPERVVADGCDSTPEKHGEYFNDNFLGKPMYWSSFDSETNIRLVKEAGLTIISAGEETADEFEKPVTYLWVVAKK